ncbi:hypothetical protein [Bacillus cereus]|uniref:hypothetical protein n=1 Tax=Bacillus cereus TaxID=1396 RepID=UPI000B4AD4F2|nr:hypothetical protein [Bacillus cereus]
MKICSIEGCNGKHQAKGLCMKHYMRMRNYKNTDDPKFINSGKTCTVDGCDKKAVATGLCGKHRWRKIKYDDPLFLMKTNKNLGEPCHVPNCNKPIKCGVLCNNHYCNYRYHLRRKNVANITGYLDLLKQKDSSKK